MMTLYTMLTVQTLICLLNCKKVYVEQSAELQRDLFAFVTKYADDNKMSYSDALQRLRGVDLSDYQANAKKYREQAKNNSDLLKTT